MKNKTIFLILVLAVNIILLYACSQPETNHYIIYPAPLEESLSQYYKVSVEGENVPVYRVKVAPKEQERRWKAMDDKKNSAKYYEEAAFAYFDMNDEVSITVTTDEEIRSVKILPSSAGIITNTEGKSVSFQIKSPIHLTIEMNGEWVRSLHLFANPFEEDVPDQDDPDVIYFGPGIHNVSNLVIGDNKTVYVAGGAIVRGIIEPDEPFTISSYSGLKRYSPSFDLQGRNITFRGRGIVDGSLCSTHSRFMIFVEGSDINLEGIILRDASHWTIPVRRSDRIHIDNLKLLGYRANSDGIDICNSRDVLVENCFIRTLDDLVVVKSDKGEGETKNIVTRKCVLWNEVAHALSIGAEISEDVDNVIFEDCDIIHDKGREWSLRIFQSDAGRVSNVRFENLRIEETQRFISLWINKSFWTRDEERGHIQGVEFKNISATGNLLNIELAGYNKEHLVEDVLFQNVMFNNKAITIEDIQTNSFVRNITVQP
ncbi:MAG: glycosyl hydrolase family 28 protein [Proteiniphilum sp.]|uniref:glycosyl hydrolase family 28 protein n=1 Tax=Proteiniphilum sp. TaxID=1926877 RepID=UPI002AB88E41|nr:glycosyl hydrolase family 28 protein [Proteiniphilum sp.]MDY9919043.1 glycosyl hydrolase family 28 protein [Proteiniphilum sp.]